MILRRLLLCLVILFFPRPGGAEDCPTIVAALLAEKRAAVEIPAGSVGWLARKFFGEARVRYWFMQMKGKLRFTDKNPSGRGFPHDYVYRTIGVEMEMLGDKAVPFVGPYVEAFIASGLKPEEAAYFLGRVARTGEPARKEVFTQLLKSALDPRAKPEARDNAAHALARLGPGTVTPESFNELLALASDTTQPPAVRAAILGLVGKFSIVGTRGALHADLPHAPEGAWNRYFFGGEPMQKIPEAAREKTVETLEALLDDPAVGPHAATALVFLSSAENGYSPSAETAAKIGRQTLAGYSTLYSRDKFDSDLAIALLARQGKIASPPLYFIEVAMSRAYPYGVRAGVLRPLAELVARNERDPGRRRILVEKLSEMLANEEIRATKHPVLAELKKYVDEQKKEEAKTLVANEAKERGRIRWAASERASYLAKEISVTLKDGKVVHGMLRSGGGLVSLSGSSNESQLGLDGIGSEKGNIYSYDLGDVRRVTHDGRVIFLNE